MPVGGEDGFFGIVPVDSSGLFGMFPEKPDEVEKWTPSGIFAGSFDFLVMNWTSASFVGPPSSMTWTSSSLVEPPFSDCVVPPGTIVHSESESVSMAIGPVMVMARLREESGWVPSEDRCLSWSGKDGLAISLSLEATEESGHGLPSSSGEIMWEGVS